MEAIFGSFFSRQIDEGDSLIPIKKIENREAKEQEPSKKNPK